MRRSEQQLIAPSYGLKEWRTLVGVEAMPGQGFEQATTDLPPAVVAVGTSDFLEVDGQEPVVHKAVLEDQGSFKGLWTCSV